MRQHSQENARSAHLPRTTSLRPSTHPSGVGFERGILAVTHSILKCYALIPKLHRILHGKLIPFCTIVQSVPKNAPKAEIADALLTADTAGSIFKNR